MGRLINEALRVSRGQLQTHKLRIWQRPTSTTSLRMGCWASNRRATCRPCLIIWRLIKKITEILKTCSLKALTRLIIHLLIPLQQSKQLTQNWERYDLNKILTLKLLCKTKKQHTTKIAHSLLDLTYQLELSNSRHIMVKIRRKLIMLQVMSILSTFKKLILIVKASMLLNNRTHLGTTIGMHQLGSTQTWTTT